MEFSPDDRVLAFAPAEELVGIAKRAALVVGVFEGAHVYDARARLRNHSNVMIVPSEQDGTLPWRDEFFSVIYAPAVTEPTLEMLRVLAQGGTAAVGGGIVAKR